MEVNLLPSQLSLLTSNAKVAALVAGIGYGKSFILAHFVLQQVLLYPTVEGLIVANTYSQLANATVPAITGLLDDLGLKYELVMSGAKKRLSIGTTNILIYSLESYDNIRGIEVGWLAGDEIAFSCRAAVDVIFGRLRDKNGSLKARFFTSPNGFNFFYDYINQAKVQLHTGCTKDNKNLPPEYYQTLLDLYGGETSPLARQELFGEFINQTSAAVYYGFKRAQHVKVIEDNKHLPIYIGLDFNVANLNATCIQHTPKGFMVVDTISLKDHDANTFSMAQVIYTRYGNRAIIIPDSTANARKTNAEAGLTDIKILKNAGLNVRPTHNPRIKDRQNSVNIAFHKDRIIIDPKCISLIKELETLSNDQDEGKVSHLAVTLGYVIWALEPLTLNNKPQQLTNPFIRNN